MPQTFTIPDYIRQEAEKIGLDPAIALAIAEKESNFNPDAIGYKDVITDGKPERAVGTFQFLPSTARKHGFDETDPQLNIQHGVRYLKDLLDRHADPYKALGEYGGVKSDTAYVPDALARIKKWQQLEAQRQPTSPNSWDTFTGEATKGLRDLWSAAKGVGSLAGTALTQDPRTTAKAVGHAAVDASNAVGWALEHPTDTAHHLFDTSTGRVRQAADRAAQAFGAGEWGQGAKELGNTTIEAVNVPLDLVGGLGTRLSEGEEHLRRGQYAKGLGKVTDVGTQVLLPEAIGKYGVPLVPRVFKPRLGGEATAAVELLQRGGVPVDVATVTGSQVARNIQAIGETTLPGGAIHEGVRWERQRALPRLATELADQVHPVPITPGEAGIGLRTGTGDAATALQQRASAAYDVVDQIASDPAHLRPVQTGTTPPPFYPPGQPRVPIVEPIQAPSDLRQIKAALAPIRDEIRAQMPLGQQQYSKGLLAIDNVLALRDFEPMLVTEKNLSALKAAARGADHPAFRGVERGTAGLAVGELSAAIDQAVAQLGPQAQAALAEGRAAARAKWAVEDLFDQMNKEKVQAFETATGVGDRHVEALTELARVAPQEIPKVGRAFLEKIFNHAAGLDQGWSKQAGVARMWETMGAETKQILFGSRTTDLNRFFLGQKMLAELANPSRSALVGATAVSLGVGLHNPMWTLVHQVGGGVIALLMNTRAGVRLLTEGLRIPGGDTTRAAAWMATVLNQVHKAGQLDQVATPPPVPGGVPEPASARAAAPPPAPPQLPNERGTLPSWARMPIPGSPPPAPPR